MSGLNLFLAPGSAASGASLPGTAQQLLDYIAANTLIDGGQNFTGINFGSTTPSPDDRDKPWLKTDPATGNPLGLYSWNGSAWVTFPFLAPSGPTSLRPLNPTIGQEYLDTTINALLIYERGAWRTASGVPGDIKFVSAPDTATALTQNPGWTFYDVAAGRTLVVTGTGSGLTPRNPGDTFGEETHTQAINEMPAHTHDCAFTYIDGTTSPNGWPVGGDTTKPKGTQTLTTSSQGGGVAFNVCQPSLCVIAMLKG